MNRILDWLFDHPVACWFIPCLAFLATGSLLVHFYGFNFLNGMCLAFGVVCGGFSYDAYEDAEP